MIEGNEPLPRILPPYEGACSARPDSPNPTAVNNVETLANVPEPSSATEPEWFRSYGTEDIPGTMLFTLSGDVRHPGVYELPPAPAPRRSHDIGGGCPPAADQGGASRAPRYRHRAEQLDTPIGFDTLGAVGSGLGSAGFVVHDDSACIVRATLAFSRFLYVESCGQCPACKHGTGAITELRAHRSGRGADADVDADLARRPHGHRGQRCALPTGESLIAQ